MKSRYLCQGCVDELDCSVWVVMPDDCCPRRREDVRAMAREDARVYERHESLRYLERGQT